MSKVFLVIGIIVFLGLGGYLLIQDSQNTANQSDAIYTDSIPVPERPSFTAQQDTNSKKDSTAVRVGEDLAPGRALIQATVLSESGGKRLVVTIDEVLGYGSSTPMLAVGAELNINVDNTLQNDKISKGDLHKGKNITLLIASRSSMAVGSSDDSRQWSLIELKSQ